MNVLAYRNYKILYTFLLLLHIDLKNRGSDPLFLFQNMCYNQVSAEVPPSIELELCGPSEDHNWKADIHL